jgi:hypothetical protein
MVSSRFVPWYNRPARPFPAQVWLEERYRFRILTPLAARRAAPSAGAETPLWVRRPFPAKVWLEARQRASDAAVHQRVPA